jgi:hypothetical protein
MNKKQAPDEIPDFSHSDFLITQDTARPPTKAGKRSAPPRKRGGVWLYGGLAGSLSVGIFLFWPAPKAMDPAPIVEKQVTSVVKPEEKPKVETEKPTSLLKTKPAVPVSDFAFQLPPQEVKEEPRKDAEPELEPKESPKILEWTPESGERRPTHDVYSPEADFLFK